MKTNHAKQGDWVRVVRTALTPEERAPGIPEETACTPLMLWVKGALLTETAAVGDEVEVETATGRRVRGKLETVAPAWRHDFGAYVPELRAAGQAFALREPERTGSGS